MPEIYAVLMLEMALNATPNMENAVAWVWLLLILGLCVRLSVAKGWKRWIGRVLFVAIAGPELVHLAHALGSSVYAFLLFPAVFWGCGWCWIL